MADPDLDPFLLLSLGDFVQWLGSQAIQSFSGLVMNPIVSRFE